MSPQYARQRTPEQRAATLRLFRCAAEAVMAQARGDLIAWADARTSTDDARVALRALSKETS